MQILFLRYPLLPGALHDHAKLAKEKDYCNMVKVILCSILFSFPFKTLKLLVCTRRRLFYCFWLFSYLFTKRSIRTPLASSTDHEIFQLHLLIGIISRRVLFFIVKRKIVGKCWSESVRETAFVSRQCNNYTHVRDRRKECCHNLQLLMTRVRVDLNLNYQKTVSILAS